MVLLFGLSGTLEESFLFCFEKVKSNRTKATCPKFLIFKMYEEKVSEPKLNAD